MKRENNLLSILKKEFSGFGSELLDGIRERCNQHIDDAVFNETLLGIDRATAALIEAGIDENKVVNLLVKHWDLRPSEAKSFIDYHKHSSEE